MLKVLGIVIAVCGAFLWLGNVFGFFRTFPLAGYITIAIGLAIAKAGANRE